MLSLFDDFPIHQTPDPVATPATSDRNFYERYWFNGYTKVGDLYLGVGSGHYPHLGIADAAISVVHDGVQHAFHASNRKGPEPTDLAGRPVPDRDRRAHAVMSGGARGQRDRHRLRSPVRGPDGQHRGTAPHPRSTPGSA